MPFFSGFVNAAGSLDYCVIESRIQIGNTVCMKGVCPYSDPSCGACCLVGMLNGITNWLFIFLIILAIIFIIIGGILFVISGGDKAKTAAARSYILYAVAGIVFGLLAKATPAIVSFFLQ